MSPSLDKMNRLLPLLSIHNETALTPARDGLPAGSLTNSLTDRLTVRVAGCLWSLGSVHSVINHHTENFTFMSEVEQGHILISVCQ